MLHYKHSSNLYTFVPNIFFNEYYNILNKIFNNQGVNYLLIGLDM